ncbi:MAG: tetratricopeptide repeat protein, partial [Pseudomonadota bacterium]
RMRLLEEATDEIDRIENVLLTDHSTRDDFSYLSSLVAEKRALLAYFGNDPERALDQYRRANEGCDIENPEHAQRCARIASSLGTVLVQRKQFGEGLKALRRARNARASLFGDDHLQVAVTNHNIGYAHFEAGEYDEAIEITSNAIRVFERLLDENHPFIGDAELVLGRIYDDLKQPENAIPHLRKSQETYAAAFGAESRKAGYGLVFLAWSQARAGRAAAAKQTLNRAYSIYEKNFEPDSFDMIDIEIYGAWIASQAGEHAFAKASCDEGLNKMIELRSENDPYVSFLQRECDSVTDRYNRHVQP